MVKLYGCPCSTRPTSPRFHRFNGKTDRIRRCVKLTLLSTWAQIGGRAIQSRVVVILDEHDFLFNISSGSSPLAAAFLDIQIFRLPSEAFDACGLSGCISEHLQHTRRARQNRNLLFSAIHFNAFFENALNHSSSHHLIFYCRQESKTLLTAR
jgi:hypothetical protein